MQIEVIKVDVENKGKYRQATVTYKTADGKVDAKKLVSFSYKEVFTKLSEATQGDIYDVKSEKVLDKDGKERWHWTEISSNGKAGQGVYPSSVTGKPGLAPSTGPKSTYETPDERAARQVYIVRQSSISNAIEFYKAKEKEFGITDVIEVAKEFEAYVFSNEVPEIEKFKAGEVK